ncbi:hypothetical protein [Paenibacillus sp. GCM10027626]|uniref:hypothetical protein n=1 Tax=Paenibacillus sp. GCM10027626 TaxID=3273411 RepID=UPI003633E21D
MWWATVALAIAKRSGEALAEIAAAVAARLGMEDEDDPMDKREAARDRGGPNVGNVTGRR